MPDSPSFFSNHPGKEESRGTLAALRLLNRDPNPEYIADWTKLLAQQKLDEDKEGTSVIIFRLGGEWLAIGTRVFLEVSQLRKIHTVPHRTSETLMGIVNLQGQITLCINMHNFLSIENGNDVMGPPKQHSGFKRMLAIQKDQDLWIFSVDEVYGIFHTDEKKLENTPVTVMKSTHNFLKGIICWHGKNVGYLDEDLLFYSLRRSIL